MADFSMLASLHQLSEQVEETQLNDECAEVAEQAFAACVLRGTQGGLSESDAGIACEGIGSARLAEMEHGEDEVKMTASVIRESMDLNFQKFSAIVSEAGTELVYELNDVLAENFEACVQRILKSGRKLKMTSRDGKTKYEDRHRAAEAACAASMASSFGKKAVSGKAIAAKRKQAAQKAK